MKKIFFLSLVLISTVVRCMEEEKIELPKKKDKPWLSLSADDPQRHVAEKNDLENRLRKAEGWKWLSANDPLRYLAMGRFPKNTYGYTEQDGEEYNNSLDKCSIQDLGNLYNAK